MMIKFAESGHPVFRETIEKRSKAKEVDNYLYTSDGDTIETVFAQLFLSISSVSTEQSQICVKKEQSDTLFAPANSLVTTPTPFN